MSWIFQQGNNTVRHILPFGQQRADTELVSLMKRSEELESLFIKRRTSVLSKVCHDLITMEDITRGTLDNNAEDRRVIRRKK